MKKRMIYSLLLVLVVMTSSCESWLDVQPRTKVKSDELAYRVTLRKYEEGLMSTLDVQTSANTLLESKANLLQKRLMYLLKSKLVDYYKGKPLINE